MPWPTFVRTVLVVQSEAPFNHQLSSLLSSEAIAALDANFTEFLRTYAAKKFANLPAEVHYYSMFEDCYRYMFYDRIVPADFCPSPLRCNTSEIPGLRCSVASVAYAHDRLYPTLVLHYPTREGTFEQNANGCRA